MLTALIAAAVLGQVRTNGLPRIKYEMPIIGGQREMVLGPKPYEFTLLNGFYERDVFADFKRTGRDTGDQYVDSVIPGGIITKSLGYFDWSCKPEKLFEKDCFLITTTGKWNQKIGQKPREVTWSNYMKQQYWVTGEGKILRHYLQIVTPDGTQTGDCTYGADSIQRRYTDLAGKTAFGEIFPACGMDALHDQFKPMIVDGKVALRDKDFYVDNPVTGGVEKYSAHVAGKFRGTYLDAGFKGTLVDIERPDKTTQKAFISDEGDLVKIELAGDKFYTINVVPKSRLDQYNRPIRSIDGKGGGGMRAPR